MEAEFPSCGGVSRLLIAEGIEASTRRRGMTATVMEMKRKKLLAGVRLPLPRQRGRVHVPRTVYRRKPRTPRAEAE
jgi:hypothetical protein